MAIQDGTATFEKKTLTNKEYVDDRIASVTRVTTGTLTILKGTADRNNLEKNGAIVEVNASVTNISGTTANTWNNIIQIPSGFLPKYVIDFAGINNASASSIQTQIQRDGIIRVWGQVTSFRCHVVYVAQGE